MVANGSAAATRVLPRHHGVVVSKQEGRLGKDGRDGWMPKIFFYRPRSVEGKTGRRMIFRGEVMRGEASFPWGDSPGAGAISRGRRRSAQKYLCTISALSRTRLFGGPGCLCAPRGVNLKQGGFPPHEHNVTWLPVTAISRSPGWSIRLHSRCNQDRVPVWVRRGRNVKMSMGCPLRAASSVAFTNLNTTISRSGKLDKSPRWRISL